MTDLTPTESFEDYRFAAYLSGAMSPEERAAFEAWIATTPDGVRRLDVARAAWTAGIRPTIHIDTDAAWVRVQSAITPNRVQSQDSTVDVPALRSVQAMRSSPIRHAAVRRWQVLMSGVIASLAAVAWLWSGGFPWRQHSVSSQYVTGVGQRTMVTLRDGTRIRLAPQTVVTLAPGFGVGTRTVSVQGEAYFEVAHTAGAPFVVRTRQTTTHVLGTAFDVRDYAEDSAVCVTVVNGKVTVARSHNLRPAITLTAGMSAVVPDSSNVAVTVGDASRTALWVDGQLVFHDTPVPAVLATITRWYGYQFRVTDSTLVALRLTVGLSTESAQSALQTLRSVLDVDLSFDRGVVVISPRRDVQAPERRQDQLTLQKTEVGR